MKYLFTVLEKKAALVMIPDYFYINLEKLDNRFPKKSLKNIKKFMWHVYNSWLQSL